MVKKLIRIVRQFPVLQVIALMPEANPGLFSVVCVLVVITGLLPVLTIIKMGALTGLIADTGISHPHLSQPIVIGIIWVVLLYLTQQLLGPVVNWVNNSLGESLSLYWRERIMKATLKPEGISHLEDPDTLDRIWMASGLEKRAFAPTLLVAALFEMISQRIHGVAAAFLLAPYQLWMPFALIISWIFVPILIAARTKVQMRHTELTSPILRRADYYRKTAMQPETAKEVRIFGLADWLINRFVEHREQGLEAIIEEKGIKKWVFLPCVLLPTLVGGLILTDLIRAALSGSITLAQFTVYTLSVISTQKIAKAMAWWTRSLFGAGAISSVLDLSDISEIPHARIKGIKKAPATIETAIYFKDVAFSYPAASIPVFRKLNLTIPAGQSLAIVGPNGIGKTTLIKLLARLYDPIEGEISIDGVDLRDIDPVSWHQRIAVIFQDFVRYELSIQENIGVGFAETMTNERKLQIAARKSGADRIVEHLPYGWDTILSRGYPNGVDLSGGQWQTVALARAFAAVEKGAKILVLDEPTANLDISVESAFFDRFLELTQGLTTILISHRMSSVRHADMICVIHDGVVAEMGSHADLMRLDKLYAHMFNLQAQHFREERKGKNPRW